jgi:glucosamine 6-phosphate synthetase-like amidotransferase/phosphosugar isomerase protein
MELPAVVWQFPLRLKPFILEKSMLRHSMLKEIKEQEETCKNTECEKARKLWDADIPFCREAH